MAAHTSPYELHNIIGSGVYGTVYKGRHSVTGCDVAIKCIEQDEDDSHLGVPVSTMREVATLRDFVNPNVVRLLDVYADGASYHLVFEYVEGGDLSKLLKAYKSDGKILPLILLKRYSFELLNGIHACHRCCILHRDIKPANVLVGPEGLKIADFGLARSHQSGRSPSRTYTTEVITLWYRAPELLLGTQHYGTEVDVWSIGCIVAELITMSAFFPGDSEIGTLFKILRKIGTPSEESWPGLGSLPFWKSSFPKWKPTIQDTFNNRPEIDEDGYDLLCHLLAMNPQARISARVAKRSSFFATPIQPHSTSDTMEGMAHVEAQGAEAGSSVAVCDGELLNSTWPCPNESTGTAAVISFVSASGA
jgi:serine/threonine protein kinase